jgi:serine/threonine protein kinase
LKCQSKSIIQKQNMKERVLNEIEIMRQLDHPFIVKFYTAMQDNRYLYFAMELLQGSICRLSVSVYRCCDRIINRSFTISLLRYSLLQEESSSRTWEITRGSQRLLHASTLLVWCMHSVPFIRSGSLTGIWSRRTWYVRTYNTPSMYMYIISRTTIYSLNGRNHLKWHKLGTG